MMILSLKFPEKNWKSSGIFGTNEIFLIHDYYDDDDDDNDVKMCDYEEKRSINMRKSIHMTLWHIFVK